jgi:adenosylmethionine-8-amino-7-oxononanoate aminotransferase
MSNQDWLTRSRDSVWHPCTQMKRHETLPIIPIAKAEGYGWRILTAIVIWMP